MDTFALRLRLARVAAGDITIDRAAVLCGLKPATWSTWERAKHTPPHRDAIALAVSAGLGVDAEWLKNGGPLNPEPPSQGGPDGRPLQAVKGKGSARSAPRTTRRNLVYSSGLAVRSAA